MISLITGIAVGVTFIAAYLFASALYKPKIDAPKYQPPTVSRSEIGATVEYYAGNVVVHGNCAWWGNLSKKDIKRDGQVVGYNNYAGILMVMAQSAHADDFCTWSALSYGGKIIRQAGANNAGNGGLLFDVNKPKLFGGDSGGGGVRGWFHVTHGNETQPTSWFTDIDPSPALATGYRGFFCVKTHKAFLGANVRNLDNFAIKLSRQINFPGEIATPSGAALGESPPVVILDVLTRKMGTPWGEIDKLSFETAIQELYDEGIFINPLVSNPVSLADFITDVMMYCDGVCHERISDGKWKIKLFRPDYDFGTLPVFSDEIIEINSYDRPEVFTAVNQITVRYREIVQEFSADGEAPRYVDDVVVLQDTANVREAGRIIDQSLDLPWVSDRGIAARIGQRALDAVSSLPATLQCSFNRVTYAIELGDVIRVQRPDLGLGDVAFRVVGIDYGDLTDGTINMDLIEDVFAMENSTYVRPDLPPEWEDPNIAPVDADAIVYEQPYIEAVLSMSIGDLSAYEAAFNYLTRISAAMAPIPSGSGFALWTKATGIYRLWDEGAPADVCEISEIDGSPSAIAIDSDGPFYLTSDDPSLFVPVGAYAILDDEWVGVTSFAALEPGKYEVYLARGAFDTLPTTHPSGSKIWFVMGTEATAYQPIPAIPGGFDAYAKLLTRTPAGELPIGDATEHSTEFANPDGNASRLIRPYNLVNIRVNGNYSPTTEDNDLDLFFDFNVRGRRAPTDFQATNGWYANANSAPEQGTHAVFTFTDFDGFPVAYRVNLDLFPQINSVQYAICQDNIDQSGQDIRNPERISWLALEDVLDPFLENYPNVTWDTLVALTRVMDGPSPSMPASYEFEAEPSESLDPLWGSIGTGDFCFDGWAKVVRPIEGGLQAIFGNRDESNPSINENTIALYLRETEEGKSDLEFNRGGSIIRTGSWKYRLNEWFWWAVCRKNGVVRLYTSDTWDGPAAKRNEDTMPQNINANSMTLGGNASGLNELEGVRMCGMRFTKFARYSGDFIFHPRRYPESLNALDPNLEIEETKVNIHSERDIS